MSASDRVVIRRKRPWGLTFFGLLAIGGLVAMPVLAGEIGDVEMPDWVRFLGHFHPVLLHLPIGVFALILVQELGAIFGSRERDRGEDSLFPMFFGAASAIMAVIAGFLLYHGHSGDYGEDPIAVRHLWGGLAFAIVVVFTFMVKAWSVAVEGNPAWYRLMLFGSVGLMGLASHDGASMTHGSDYLTRYAPNSVRMILGLEPNEPNEAKETRTAEKPAAEQVVYTDIVAPIFERRCVSCHKEGKSKGKLRMDTYELLVKGGKEGPGIEPGSSADSNVVFRIELPEDDDEHMPPEGKPQLELAEIELIKWWIDQGADPEKPLSEYVVTAEIQKSLELVAGISPSEEKATVGHPEAAGETGPDEALVASLSALSKEFPGAVSFESQGSPLVVFTGVSLRGKLDDSVFSRFKPVVPQLVSVDLSATRITDQAVQALESAANLRMVRLSETAVTDSAIDTLVKLTALESINLFGTKVTDAGVGKLAGLPKLKRLYLWQTAVTPDAIKTLEEALPDCEIVAGAVSSVGESTEGK